MKNISADFFKEWFCLPGFMDVVPFGTELFQ